MGEIEIRVATGFLRETGLIQPFSAEVAAVEAGLLLCPSTGPATLVPAQPGGERGGPLRDRGVLRYDESRPGWEREVWSLVCGALLRRAGVADTPGARIDLAHELGADIEEVTGVVAPLRAVDERPLPARSNSA